MRDYNKLIELQLKQGKSLEIIKKTIRLLLEQENKEQFENDLKAEYDKLYPIYRPITDEEYQEYLDLRGNEDSEPKSKEELSKKVIYDITPPTFEEYKNETKIIKEAIYDDGTLVSDEIIEKVRPYIPKEILDVDILDKLNSFESFSKYKIQKEDKALNSLKVTTNSVPFDADTISINYMDSVLSLAIFKFIKSLSDIDESSKPLYDGVFKSTVNWKNAKDEISTVEIETLAETLEKAMMEVASHKVGE
jgi:hypothetical protein